ncbi:hypothetical protein D3C71_2201790 [compost metagenome]
MELHEAKQMMAAVHQINSDLNDAAEMADSIADKEIQKNIKLQLGTAMGRIYVGIMHPIIKQFNELDPDRSN